MYAYKYAYPSIVSLGGIRQVGIVLQGVWFEGDTTDTMNASFIVSYRITDSTKSFSEIRTTSPTIAAGVNTLQISDDINGEPYTFDYTINLVDSFTITTTPDAFSFVKTEQLTALLAGGAYSQAIPFAGVNSSFLLQYMGGQDTLEGDYGIYYQFSDANGVTFYSSDNGQTFKWAPRVVIVSIDGNKNLRDPLPEIAKSSVVVKYVVGLEILTQGNDYDYDINGEIQYFGTEADEKSANVSLIVGSNVIQILDVADDFGNLKDSDTRTVIGLEPVGPPQPLNVVQNVEGLGDIINILTYDPANGYVFAEDVTGTSFNANILVDFGFTSATSFIYAMTFISGDYRNYTFNIPYTNPITSEIFYVEVTVEYKATLVYEDFATNLFHFGDPTGGTAASVTIINDTVDKYQDVFDLIEAGASLSEVTPAEMPLVTVSGIGKNGAEMVISDVITLTKTRTGNEGWYLSEHCFVITFQAPTARGPYFQFPTITIGADIVLQFLDFGGGFKVGVEGTLGTIVHAYRDYVTVLVGINATGDMKLYSSGGDDITIASHPGWQVGNLLLGNTDDRQTTDAIFYEIGCIDHFPDATERTDIFARSVTKWETV